LEFADVDELVGRDDAFGFAADIDDDFVLADFGDGARDDGAFLQFIEGRLREQLLHYRTHNERTKASAARPAPGGVHPMGSVARFRHDRIG